MKLQSVFILLNFYVQVLLGSHDKDKNTLATTKSKLREVSKEVEEMGWDQEVLQQKLNQVNVRRYMLEEVRARGLQIQINGVIRSVRREMSFRKGSDLQSWRFNKRLDSSKF